MRLHKFLSICGVTSRRSAEKLVAAGRVTVNGHVVSNVRRGIDPETDEIRVDGTRVQPKPKVYIMLNKPMGYLTTMKDPHGRPTISELIQDVPQRVVPVGRLDKGTKGLLIMTNDGNVTYCLTHPKFELKKTYHAVVEGNVTEKELDKLRSGIELSDGAASPAEARVIARQTDTTALEITIPEGRKRQVRRMCSAIHHEVVELTRVAMAGIVLNDVAEGRWRYLSPQEVSHLCQLVSQISE